MVVLAALGKLGVRSFPSRLPDNYLDHVKADHEPYQEELMLVQRVGAPPELRGFAQALRRMERRRQWRRTLRSVAQLTGVLPPLKAARDALQARKHRS
jgi:hypothetical protein